MHFKKGSVPDIRTRKRCQCDGLPMLMAVELQRDGISELGWRVCCGQCGKQTPLYAWDPQDAYKDWLKLTS